MFARWRFFLKQAVSALSRSIGITVLSVVTIAVALAVLATFAVVLENLSRLAEDLGRDVEISVYLEARIPRERQEALAREVRAWEHVADVRAITGAEALREFRQALGKDAILLEGLPPDVLPPSLELRLRPRDWTSGEVRALSDAARALEGVEDVRFGQEDIERVYALLSFARVASLVLGVSLALATILIISNTIRLTVYARRDEIEIMSLVGATNTFVRMPFVLEGAIQGLLGGAVAFGALLALDNAVRAGLERGFNYAYGPIAIDFVPAALAGYLIASGIVLGLVGSVLAVGRFLRV